jgi:hypothetical protein
MFTDLHDVAQVLSEHIREQLGFTDVQPGEPRSVNATTTPGIRITLIYVTPQGTHRNDPWERQADGQRVAPPFSLSCFYLITASGMDSDDPIAAHNALGQVMRLFHTMPTLALPLSDSFAGSPGTGYTELGEGRLTLVQMPMMLEQLDKIWTSLEAQLQPWVMYEVGPVQLASLEPDREPAPVVRPGGVEFIDVRAGLRPLITRVTPAQVRPRGRLRIDAAIPATLEQVIVDGIPVLTADPSLTRPVDDGPLLLVLDSGGLENLGEGNHHLSIQAGRTVSRREVLRIAPANAAVIDAPATIRHSVKTDLVLTGANLGGALEAVLWPDQGLAAPSEVIDLPVVAVADGAVTIPATGSPAGLGDADFGSRLWRLVIRVGAHVYTPYVVLEFAP